MRYAISDRHWIWAAAGFPPQLAYHPKPPWYSSVLSSFDTGYSDPVDTCFQGFLRCSGLFASSISSIACWKEPPRFGWLCRQKWQSRSVEWLEWQLFRGDLLVRYLHTLPSVKLCRKSKENKCSRWSSQGLKGQAQWSNSIKDWLQ